MFIKMKREKRRKSIGERGKGTVKTGEGRGNREEGIGERGEISKKLINPT